jgi:hypothetical protein
VATLFGVVLIAGGIAILAVVRPWRRDDDDDELDDATQIIPRIKPRPVPSPGPGPGSGAGSGPGSKRPSPRGTANARPTANAQPGANAKLNAKPPAHPGDHEPAAGRRHRVEAISRARRVPPEPGREEIMLPEWLGPVSGPR